MESDPVVVQARSLSRAFGPCRAVAAVSLELRAGQVLGLIGRNGSGKSTTLRMLAGLLAPDGGSLAVLGQDLSQAAYPRQQVGVLPEGLALMDLLSAQEHLLLAGSAYGIPLREVRDRSRQLLTLLDLWGARERRPEQLSYGMAKKLSLAMALIHNPRLLLLDEPFEGIDPVHAATLREVLLALAAKGVAIVLSSHSLALTEQVVEPFVMLVQGEVACRGSVSALRAQGRTLEDCFLALAPAPPVPDLAWIG
jgi:ABC-2 type transport system ATP-binding protein